MILRALLVFLALSSNALSQSALIKSGEHPSFSRLVVYEESLSGWTQSRNDQTVTIRFGTYTSGFRGDAVFDFIPKTRLLDLSSTASELTLDLGCACEVLVERLDGVGVIIDILDAPPAPDLEIAVEPAGRATPTSPAPRSDTFRLPIRPARSTVTGALRASLQNKVSAATDGGLLQPSTQSRTGSQANTSELNDIRDIEKRIRTSSALQNLLPDDDLGSASPVDGECLDPVASAIEEWSGSLTFGDRIGEIRQELVSELGEFDSDQALDLVRFYLAYAMGTEALELLDLLETESKDVEALRLISQIIENEDTQNRVSNLEHCRGSALVWDFLGRSSIEYLSPEVAKEISRAFQIFPEQVQTIIGPRVISRLRDAGQDLASQTVRTSLENRGGTDTSLTSVSPLTSLSRSDLLDLIVQKDARAKNALLILFEKNWAEKTILPGNMKPVIESYVFEFSTPDLANLFNLGIGRNALLEGNIGTALMYASKLDGSPEYDEFAKDLIHTFLGIRSDVSFLKASLDVSRSSLLDEFDNADLLTASKRLKKLGFGSLSEAFLEIENVSKSMVSIEPEIQALTSDERSEIDESQTFAASETLDESRKSRERIAELISQDIN